MRQDTLCNGAFVQVTPGEGRHHVGGENRWTGAQCPNCRQPLVLFLTLDITDPVLDFPDVGLSRLPLLECPRCRILGAPFVYRVLSDTEVEIIEFREGKEDGLARDWLSEHGDEAIELAGCTLFPFPREVQDIIDRHDDGHELSAEEVELFARYAGCYAAAEVGGYACFGEICQVGGRAYLPQGLILPECPYCRDIGPPQEMLFLACLTEHQLGAHIFFPEGYLEFYFCPDCRCILGQSFAT